MNEPTERTPDPQFAEYAMKLINSATIPVAEMSNVHQTMLWLQEIVQGKTILVQQNDQLPDAPDVNTETVQ